VNTLAVRSPNSKLNHEKEFSHTKCSQCKACANLGRNKENQVDWKCKYAMCGSVQCCQKPANQSQPATNHLPGLKALTQQVKEKKPTNMPLHERHLLAHIN